MSSVVYEVGLPTTEISKLAFFVRCTGLQVDHLIDRVAQFYFVIFLSK